MSRILCCCWLLTISAGCALHRSHAPALSPPFPEASLTPASAQPAEQGIATSRELAARPRPEPAVPRALTVEGSNPALAASLLRLQASASAEAHVRVGEQYRDAGIPDTAHLHFEAAARLSPGNADAHEGVARIWRDWGMPGAGLGAAHRAVFHAPSSASAHNTLGTILLALGRATEARSRFERVLALDPGAPYALNNVCYAYVMEGQGAKAIDYCREALRREPGFVGARHNLALAYASAGDIEAARRELLSAADPGAVQYNLGILALTLGHFEEAEAAFRNVLRIRPGDQRATDRAREAGRRAATGTGEGHGDGRW